ncbi:unnamed protein product [Tuber melanosporum]|uniref:(Perigord truffle) hypothetical protein n=1 Tax=Tuber melanosporum (strain Mel28) TaxID=656061 RepID=D5GKP3_TUBMM|nr:uncharacterized protein GSTUM_00009679001 [Tuber melanosporum]CAZ85086.1 unnamed protein product [Tuber melanosporum]
MIIYIVYFERLCSRWANTLAIHNREVSAL